MFKFKGNKIYDIMNLGAQIFLTVEMFLLNKWNNKENLLVKFLMNFFFLSDFMAHIWRETVDLTK